jgi:hypothetical protein
MIRKSGNGFPKRSCSVKENLDRGIGANAMQIVNGYICMNCCDVDKARLGQDPHQQANQIQKQLKGTVR